MRPAYQYDATKDEHLVLGYEAESHTDRSILSDYQDALEGMRERIRDGRTADRYTQHYDWCEYRLIRRTAQSEARHHPTGRYAFITLTCRNLTTDGTERFLEGVVWLKDDPKLYDGYAMFGYSLTVPAKQELNVNDRLQTALGTGAERLYNYMNERGWKMEWFRLYEAARQIRDKIIFSEAKGFGFDSYASQNGSVVALVDLMTGEIDWRYVGSDIE